MCYIVFEWTITGVCPCNSNEFIKKSRNILCGVIGSKDGLGVYMCDTGLGECMCDMVP